MVILLWGECVGAAIFDMEYARWIEDEQRHMTELRAGLQAHLPDSDLRVIVDGYIQHYDEVFRLKAVAAKTDVFHLLTGMWTTPAERCFLWMGGFKPSELIKVSFYSFSFLFFNAFILFLLFTKAHIRIEEAILIYSICLNANYYSKMHKLIKTICDFIFLIIEKVFVGN